LKAELPSSVAACFICSLKSMKRGQMKVTSAPGFVDVLSRQALMTLHLPPHRVV
jgi:hypothetical protein